MGSSGGDTTPPNVMFIPQTLSVQSGQTGTSTLTRSDAGGSTTIISVNCTNGGVFNGITNLFTAATVTENTPSVCTATVRDASQNRASATLTVTMTPPPPDTSAPALTFNPTTLTVASGSTGTSTLTITDAGGVSATPTASCTNGGDYNVSSGVFTPADVTANTTSVCTVTVTDDAGNLGTGTLTVTMTPPSPVTGVTLSGKATYDRVPFNTNSDGLDYNSTIELPIRQAPVQLLNASGVVLDTTVSDDNGDYSFIVDAGENVRVRVLAEVQKGAPNEIDFQILDNTSGNSLYALQGPLSVVPTVDQTRNLNADSGWGGSSYTMTRAAAPFALLDTIYTSLEAFIAVDAEVDFPAFEVLWSTRNRAASGSVSTGNITTSSFTRIGGVPTLLILGDEDNDTDEYDVHVVVHEFGHYFEDQVSRSDSVGGPHSTDTRLDSRVAFGEGWGNALSGMVLDDPIYRDSAASGQSFDQVVIDVENNTYAVAGWYSSGSIQSILYDLYDSRDDGADAASYGLGPIYGAFTDPAYRDSSAFTTIFSFLDGLSNQADVVASEVTAITAAQFITGSGQFGVGETNNGDLPDSLPVYLTLPTDNTPVEFCSRNTNGEFNRHGNRRFFEFEVAAAGDFRFLVTRLSGSNTSNPDFEIFKDGTSLGGGFTNTVNVEDAVGGLTVGRHILEAYDRNVLNGTTDETCFTMRLDAQ